MGNQSHHVPDAEIGAVHHCPQFRGSLRYQRREFHVLPKITTWLAGAEEDRAALSGRPRKANAGQYAGARLK
jgi:hypothetical protein